MKKALALLPALLAGLLVGCGSKNAADFYGGVDGVDYDLTRLSSTMVYSEIYNMRYTPEDYYGKVIRVEGLFSAYENPETGEPYFNIIVPDATACCSQGLQFFPAAAEELSYPADYPENGETVTVVGTFTRNEENLYMCSLNEATITPAEP